MTKTPLDISVHALPFRAAQVFDTSDRDDRWIRIEPIQQGGVVIIAKCDGDMIVVPDATGYANRAATIISPGALTKLAVDMFRREGVETRLRVAGELAWVEPEMTKSTPASRNVEIDTPFLDWRARLAPHANCQLRLPVTGDGRMAQRLANVAINLGRAGGSDDGVWRLCGGHNGALLASFPAWPGAVAIFADTQARAEQRHQTRTDWSPPDWATPRPRLAIAPTP